MLRIDLNGYLIIINKGGNKLKIETDRYKLYNGDCLEIMDKLIEEGVVFDAIITDPPYGTTDCRWDSVIPLDEMWNRINKLIKDTGAIALFGSQPFTSVLISSNIKCFREEIIWLKNKSGSGLQAKQKHIKVHENIVVFSKKRTYTYNPQKWLVSDKEFLTQRKTFKELEVANNIYQPMKRVQKKDDGTRNPISIVSSAVPFTPSKSKTYSDEVDIRYHETQKPIKLMEYLVKTYTDENDLILDFTMGSGSTGVACMNLNRKFVGIELDEKYFNIAKERIENN